MSDHVLTGGVDLVSIVCCHLALTYRTTRLVRLTKPWGMRPLNLLLPRNLKGREGGGYTNIV